MGGALQYGGYFNDELDAAKRVNQLCKESSIPEKNPGINGIPKQLCQRNKKASQYKGVCWHKENKKWFVKFNLGKGQAPKYGGYFIDELDAAKGVNQLCKEMGILEKNPAINGIPSQQYKATEKTSQYKGVTWHKQYRKWYASFRSKDGKKNYGGSFSDELDAAKRVNQLCEELEIPEKNPGIGTMLHQHWQAKQKTSQYIGVHWSQNERKWRVLLCSKSRKPKYGGIFNDELDAGKRVNQLCEEFGIPKKNPGIGTIPHQQCQVKEKTSQYKGVHWIQKSKKWHAGVRSIDGKMTYGGTFSDELDAAKRVNQLCEEIGIPQKNFGIGKTPHQQWKGKNKTSQYKGVYWHRERRKWYARLRVNGAKPNYGGSFSDELDAAKRVNQLCKELGIPPKNPGIGEISHQIWQHIHNQTIIFEEANSVMGSEIVKIDDSDGTKEKKRKRTKNFIIDDKSSLKQYYFYEDLLK